MTGVCSYMGIAHPTYFTKAPVTLSIIPPEIKV